MMVHFTEGMSLVIRDTIKLPKLRLMTNQIYA
jgi:succinate dehydrogenase hydrophobic anchor subunit